MIKVIFPNGDSVLEHITATLDILEQIDSELNHGEEIALDFTDVSWVVPCSIIILSNKTTELIEKKIPLSCIFPKNKKVREYMQKIGFPLGKKEDGNSYISINHFKKNPNDKNQVNKEVNNLIDKIEIKIPNEFGGGIKYILGELSDNIDDHSEFTFVSLMAQYFPKKEKMDLAIFDNGISIPALFEKHSIKFEEDSDAIMKAVCGKVTTKKGEEMRGYGLKSCKDLSTKGMTGELYIISRKGVLIIKSDEEPIFYNLDKNFLQGTFLYFRLDTPKEKINLYKYV